MIVVVADTSPLNYLVQIECQNILPALYERILVPEEVVEELSHPRTPAAVRAWADKLPDWLEVRQVYKSMDGTLAGLGPGEQGAIQLAQDLRADLLLMDERKGTKIARKRGLKVAGTLGILLIAARRGLVDIDLALARLEMTDFRSTPELFRRVRQLAH